MHLFHEADSLKLAQWKRNRANQERDHFFSTMCMKWIKLTLSQVLTSRFWLTESSNISRQKNSNMYQSLLSFILWAIDKDIISKRMIDDLKITRIKNLLIFVLFTCWKWTCCLIIFRQKWFGFFQSFCYFDNKQAIVYYAAFVAISHAISEYMVHLF